MNEAKFKEASDLLNKTQDMFRLCHEGDLEAVGLLRPLIDMLQLARRETKRIKEQLEQ